jgi:hypothetical protein
MEILKGCRKTICVEVNYTGQFARYLRAETGFGVDDLILKYDGEPFEPHHIVDDVKAILQGRLRSTDVTLEEAREMAYHYIRTHLGDAARSGRIEKVGPDGYDEPIWLIEIVSRDSGEKQGDLLIGVETGSTYSWRPM